MTDKQLHRLCCLYGMLKDPVQNSKHGRNAAINELARIIADAVSDREFSSKDTTLKEPTR